MYFEIYREQSANSLRGLLGSTTGEWRWRLRGTNHEPIASGESYPNKADCLHAIALVKSTTAATPVKDLG
jgi:uncharacterized protein YegP (UPF0339 family)